MKILFLAIASDSELYSKHRSAQADTWGRINKSRLIWMLGDPRVTKPELLNSSVLKLPVEEKFENILRKTILGIEWALKNCEFDYLIRLNTSTFVNEKMLVRWLNKQEFTNFIAGETGVHPILPSGEKRVVEFVAGNFIVLPKSICELLVGIDLINYHGYPDDVAISHFLQEHEVTFKRIRRNDMTDNFPFIFSIQHRIKSWENGDLVTLRFGEITSLLESRIFKFPILLSINNINEYRRMSMTQSRNSIYAQLRRIKFLIRCSVYLPWNIYQKFKYNLSRLG